MSVKDRGECNIRQVRGGAGLPQGERTVILYKRRKKGGKLVVGREVVKEGRKEPEKNKRGGGGQANLQL